MENSVCKIQISDSGEYYANTNWVNKVLEIKLFDSKNCWTGNLLHEDIIQFSRACNETEESYVQKLKQAFSVKNDGYLFEFVQNSDESAELIWLKRFEDGTEFKVGGVTLTSDSKSNKDDLLDYLIEKNYEMQNTINKMMIVTDEHNEELKRCKEEWKEDIEQKITLEKELYSKFTLLLNAKKKRIQDLEKFVLNYTD